MKVATHRLRVRFREHIRAEVTATVNDRLKSKRNSITSSPSLPGIRLRARRTRNGQNRDGRRGVRGYAVDDEIDAGCAGMMAAADKKADIRPPNGELGREELADGLIRLGACSGTLAGVARVPWPRTKVLRQRPC